LTRSQGVTTSDGSVLRWLNCSDIRLVTQASEFAGTMRSQLNACREALKCGVGRARVFPLSEIGQLPLFYVSRINAGTEVILS
jgi:acetylglutamate kinase